MIRLVWLLIKKCLLLVLESYARLWGLLNIKQQPDVDKGTVSMPFCGREIPGKRQQMTRQVSLPTPCLFRLIISVHFHVTEMVFFLKNYFALLSRRQTNIHCVSGTFCIALTMLGMPPTCQERHSHKLQRKLPANVLLTINGSGELVFAIFEPAVGKQKRETFCSKCRQRRQTS